MAPEEESKAEVTQPETPGPRGNPRRERGPGRGRRGRGRGRRPKQPAVGSPDLPEAEAASAPAGPEPVFELADEPGKESEPETPVAELAETVSDEEPSISPPVGKSGQPASPASVEQAIEEVSGVIDSLRSALDDMEEVLEMLEMFERQKNADEREIDSLRHALRQMHRPRDGGHHPHR